MAGGVALAAAAGGLVVYAGRASLGIALPFVALWMLSPAIARWASYPLPVAGREPISAADVHALRAIARRTWRFFETFVTPEDHMLPPDNFQEDPAPVVAHRTSPTNLGLYLLSVVSARDFGWLGLLDTVERLETTLASMNALERFRGHFYNWYDTRELRPLEPKYVSSVDSGNLAGHLIALESACREMIAAPIVSPEWLAGIRDTLALTREALRGASRRPANPDGDAQAARRGARRARHVAARRLPSRRRRWRAGSRRSSRRPTRRSTSRAR